MGQKFKIKQWKITKTKRTKFSDTNRCIKIRLGAFWGVNWGEMVRKVGELTYKCSGINSSQVCDSNIHKKTIKYSNSLADRQQDCTFISFENGGGEGVHTTENSCTSASPFGVTFSANKLQCLQSIFPVL